MPLSPAPVWASSYEKALKDTYADYKEGSDGDSMAAKMWQKWIDDNSNKVQCVAPFFAIPPSPTLVKAVIQPKFKAPGTAATTAIVLAGEWAKYWNNVTWSLPPGPYLPPFSSVTGVITDPGGVAAAQAILQTQLTAELAVISDTKVKAQKLGAIFAAAGAGQKTIITGMSMSVPPAPLFMSIPVL